jgi:hypothetical protein
LGCLIEQLKHPKHCFYIHIDKQKEIAPFQKFLEKIQDANIIYLERLNSYWGSYNCVKVIINGLKKASADKFDYYIHLSAQDFPLRTNEEIQQKLKSSAPLSFMHHFKLTESTWVNKGKDRLETLHFFINGKRFSIGQYTKNKLYKMLYAIWNSLVLKQFDTKQTYYGCEFYFMFHHDTVDEFLNNLRQNFWLYQRLKFTLIPEEIFIPTILFKSKSKIDVVNKTLRYIKWEGLSSSPKILDEQDIAEFSKDDYLFGRKFDFEINPDLHQKLIAYLKNRNH